MRLSTFVSAKALNAGRAHDDVFKVLKEKNNNTLPTKNAIPGKTVLQK